MRCLECSGFFVSKRGDLTMSDDILGDFIVPEVEYEMCEECGEQLFPPATLEAIEIVEERIKNKLLLQMPLNDFIPATEVADILGCTRQAVHKHRRIRKGFIHFVKHYGQFYYHKKSVALYKETGDGRFRLAALKPNIIKFSDIPSGKEKNLTSLFCSESADSIDGCFSNNKGNSEMI